MKKVEHLPQSANSPEESGNQRHEVTLVGDSTSSTAHEIQSNEGLAKAIKNAQKNGPTPEEAFPVDEEFVAEVGTRARQLKQSTLNKQDDNQNTVPNAGNASTHSQFDPASAEGEIGRIGTYRILRLIGQGGMGQVYEAEDTQLNRRVAIKVMQASLSGSQHHRARFLREAQLAAKVESDFVCPIYQVGENSHSPFIAMPFLQGQSLEMKLSRNSLTIAEALAISIQIAKGLSAAHALNLTHRDIKPSNVFMEARSDKTERVRILDFGLARVEEGNLTLTGEGTILGTPAYMSPEQARGENLDSRSDLFSLGVVLYEMLTGERPFKGKSATSLISSLLVDEPKSPEAHKSSIPKELSQLVMHLLEKSPKDRIASAPAVVNALEACLEQLSREQTVELPSSLPYHAAGIADELSIGANTTQAAEGKPRRRSKYPAWIGLSAAAAGMLFWMASILVFTTPNGTLIIEADDEADIRLKNGEIHVFDENGKLAYKLAPSERHKGIASGTYLVKVEGTDGVQLDTPKFEMKKNERVVVRATSIEPTRTASKESSAAPTRAVEEMSFGPKFFPGKLVIDNLAPSIGTNLIASDVKRVAGMGNAVVLRRENANAQETIPTKLVAKLPSGAFALRATIQNARFYANFRSRYRDDHVRWLCLGYHNSVYGVSLQHHQLINNRWEVLPSKDIAVFSLDALQGVGEKQFQVCGRWSETDYDLWFNGQHLVGGEIEDEGIFRGMAGPLEFVIRAIDSGETRMMMEELWVWDQSKVPVAEASSDKLPIRKNVQTIR